LGKEASKAEKKRAAEQRKADRAVPELDPDFFEMDESLTADNTDRDPGQRRRTKYDTDPGLTPFSAPPAELQPDPQLEDLAITEIHSGETPGEMPKPPTARAPGWENSVYFTPDEVRAQTQPQSGATHIPPPKPAPQRPDFGRTDRNLAAGKQDLPSTEVPGSSAPKPKRTTKEFAAVSEAAKELARAALAAEIEKEEKQALKNYEPEEGEIPPSPEVAKRFDVILQLGKGGMAVVYLCRDPRREGRVFAVKDIRAEMKPGMKVEQRVESEVKLLKGLDHPGIVKVYDLLHFQRGSAIVMEYIDGLPLDHEIGGGRRISWDFAVRVLHEIGQALQYAHERGVIHRDIKPDNILWSERHNVLKLVDFGLARIFGEDAEAHMTRTGMVVGTPHYMSPEQVSGKPLDGRSDQYSLGATLYYLLTGQRHVEGENITDILIQQRSREIVPPNHLQRDIPPWLSYIIGRMMEIKPTDRYADMNAMLHDLSIAEQNPERFLTDPQRPKVKRFGSADLNIWAQEDDYFGSGDEEIGALVSGQPAFHSERMTNRVSPGKATTSHVSKHATRRTSRRAIVFPGNEEQNNEVATLLLNISNRLDAVEKRSLSPGMLMLIMLLAALIVALGTLAGLLFVIRDGTL
jgi:serine/threonine protein kinase